MNLQADINWIKSEIEYLILYTEKKLLNQLDISERDQQFLHLRNDYKKLLTKYYKLTFRTINNTAFIVRVFDARQHPDESL